MRKLIDIPDNIVQDLKKMAIEDNKDLKNFIQDHMTGLHRIWVQKKVQSVKRYKAISPRPR
jgi:hypothetical protein